MTDTTPDHCSGSTPHVAPPPGAPQRGFAALDLDTRLLGMIGAFILICLAFHLASDGRFVTPRNLFNLTIQTAARSCTLE